jgi:hypothetical protein
MPHDADDAAVWLLLLDRGRRTGDAELAARAARELARRGIRVTYGRPRTPGVELSRPPERPEDRHAC